MSKLLDEGWAHYQQNRFRAALNAAEAVLTLPDSGRPMVRIRAQVLAITSRYWLDHDLNAGLRALRKLLKQAPDSALVHHHLGDFYTFAGRLEEARSQFETVLELVPNDAGSFQRLAAIKKYERLDPLAERMAGLAERGDLPAETAIPLHNGLAKIYADTKDFEKAFRHAVRAKELSKGSYIPGTMEQFTDSLEKLRAEGGFRHSPPSGNQSEKPLFIVGLARSGTTLVETILGQHTDVRTCGELHDIQDIETSLTKAMSARAGKQLSHLQAAYLATPDDLRPHAEAMLKNVHDSGKGTYRLFTDKMPTNGPRLGLIARLFPKARVVFLRRDLRDCAVSNLFTLLPSPYAYSQRLDWFAHYATRYYRIVETWRDMLDIEFLDLSYEELVSDPEPQVRRLLGFAGLKFQPACLTPERGTTQIRTASIWQARQSINAKSVGRWKDYEPWLGPLLDGLDRD